MPNIPENTKNITKSTYLDKEGLSKVIEKIKDIYARQDVLNKKEQDLYAYIDAETQRAIEVENTNDQRAQGEEERIEGRLNDEISRAMGVEGGLESAHTALVNRVVSLETNKVNDVLVNNISRKDPDGVVRIQVDAFTDASIKVVDELPNVGENNKLYIKDDVIYQYSSEGWIEAGKYNVLLVDELPEVGDPEVLYVKSSDHSINIYIGGDDPDTRWQEISGQDKELRAQFEDFKTDHPDFHVEWDDVDNKPETYTPASHIHDNRYYTQEQIDTMLHDGPVSHEEMEEHVSSSNPHPNFKAVIDDLLSQKASTQMVMTHINNTSNPHAVSKEQVGLGNVDNTSDLEKPVSLLTQAALSSKADYDWTLTELTSRLKGEDVVDNLYTHQSEKPLSAEQGTVLDGKILSIDTKVESLGAALTFKGTVQSREYLNLIPNPQRGDSYQINSGEGGEDNGAMYAWNGDEWVNIVASATDLSSLIATDAEVHSIIDEYN